MIEALRDRKFEILLVVNYKAYQRRQKLPSQNFETMENCRATVALLDKSHYDCTRLVITTM
jgi:hypothetical protein